jgi:hypothetical protein
MGGKSPIERRARIYCFNTGLDEEKWQDWETINGVMIAYNFRLIWSPYSVGIVNFFEKHILAKGSDEIFQ